MSGHCDVLIVGAGHAGLAASYFLSAAGIEHAVLERGQIANAWVNHRWDSFCLVTPNWTITLPGAEYNGVDSGGFMLRNDFVAYMRNWAHSFSAPVRCGVEVTRISGESGDFRLETSDGPVGAKAVIVATATYHKPKPVPIKARLALRLHQCLATDYKNPAMLPSGAVLVVGSGQSGCQIAEELMDAGRDVHLCVGRAGRLPRRYRGKDCIEWQRDMRWLERTPDFLERPEHRFRGDPHLSGKNGGHTISLHCFRARGMHLHGHICNGEGERLSLSDDLTEGLKYSDDYALNYYKAVDDHIAVDRLAAPEPTSAELDGGPIPVLAPMPSGHSIDLKDRQISTIIWATGFTYDFSWIDFPVFDGMGYPVTDRGVTSVPGFYFMGLNWMHKRKSGIIYGACEDAAHVSAHIAGSLSGNIPA